MGKYFVQCFRPQKESVLKEYPNLTADRRFTMGKMQTSKDLEELPKDTIRKVVENWAEKQLEPHDKIDYNEVEEVNVVTQTKHKEKDDTTPVYDGKIDVPEKVREQEEEKSEGDGDSDSKSGDGSLGGGLM